jgi:hypothetical protein
MKGWSQAEEQSREETQGNGEEENDPVHGNLIQAR